MPGSNGMEHADLKHLFSPEGSAALAATMRLAPLLAFDFDGTLAPIVARHDDARVPLSVTRRLQALSRTLPLAIVSGRSVADVLGRIDFEPRFIVGNHGAENPVAPLQPDAVRPLDAVRERWRAQAQELVPAGISIEDKQHSLALHYRLAPDRERAHRLITALLQGLPEGIRVFGGKMVVNVASSQAPDKAHAVMALIRHAQVQAAVFVGDDVNDEPVFACAQPNWLTVRVGRDDPETRAMYCLDHFSEVATMLDRMLASPRAAIA